MVQTWPENPQFKLIADAEEFVNDKALGIRLVRPENSVSDILLTVDDYKSSGFVDIFNVFAAIELHLRYGSDAWTKVFSGIIKNVSPSLTLQQGETLVVTGEGEGRAVVNTHCNTSFGVESQNPTKDTPKEIWDDLVDNFINKAFGGGATGYAITKTKIANIADPAITHILSPYSPCFNIINRVCEIYTAYRAGSASVHWFVDPAKNLFVNTIGAHENNASGWPTFWKGSEALSTLAVKEDQLLYQFQKRVNHFANKILLCSTFRKPPYDHWTNNQSAKWGSTTAILTDDAGTKVVGTHSLKIEPENTIDAAFAWYPSAKDAGWDFEKIGSERTIPSVNFYAQRNQDLGAGSAIRLCTSDADYFRIFPLSDRIGVDNEFVHLTFPIGPYYSMDEERRRWRWAPQGSPVWSNINYIMFIINSGSGLNDLWLDDLHFAGKIIREAYNSTSIADPTINEIQRVIRNDVALDDTLKASDDSGTAARLAYAELLRRQTIPLVSTLRLPMAPTMLPGQFVHIHSAQKADDSYRVDENFRVTQLIHNISLKPWSTTINLTNDLVNSFAFGPPTRASVLAEHVGALKHREAHNLKGSGIDVLIPRLSKDYPS